MALLQHNLVVQLPKSVHSSVFTAKVNSHYLPSGQLTLASLSQKNSVKRSHYQQRQQHLIRCEAGVQNGGVVPGEKSLTPAEPYIVPDVKRNQFPADFKFGTSTSALQTEGSAHMGGRGDATWDSMITMGTEFPGIKATENVATLSYYRYKEDIKLLSDMGVDTYRFSISWSRILPEGAGKINQDGIDFYNNLIDEMLANGIEPCVTLYHFDLPKILQVKYNGFLDKQFVEDYKNYCDICFKNFGDRVKRWISFNEPGVIARYAYSMGLHIKNDKTTYPYLAAHHLILGHAAASQLYKQKYKKTQGGEIGMSISSEWFEPHSQDIEDIEAAERGVVFAMGWFLDPLYHGDYPAIMKTLVGDRLPTFTAEEKAMLKGSCDYVGLNYYTGRYAEGLPIDTSKPSSGYDEDRYLEEDAYRNGEPIGEPVEGNSNLYVVPHGLRELLLYIQKTYNDPEIYITENGVSEPRDDTLPLEVALNDEKRIIFIKRHLGALLEALSKDVKVKGYFIWTLLDNMEIGAGNNYGTRFGLNFTDYTKNLERVPKSSALWYKSFLQPEVNEKASETAQGKSKNKGRGHGSRHKSLMDLVDSVVDIVV